MTNNTEIAQLIELHEGGVFTLRELLPLLVDRTSVEDLHLLRDLPERIHRPFVEWVRDYPLEGGIQIRDEPNLSVEKLAWLKLNIVTSA